MLLVYEGRSNSPVKFSEIANEWTVYVPNDIPKQHDPINASLSGRDCSVFVCMWTYSICSRAINDFKQDNLLYTIQALSRYLINTPLSNEISHRNSEMSISNVGEGNKIEKTYWVHIPANNRTPPRGYRNTSEYLRRIHYKV